MRPIHLVRLDKTRPAVILTRELARPYLASVTVAPITTRIRGLSTEVRVGVANGLDQESAVSCDNIQTVPAGDVGKLLGYLLPHQEGLLTQAVLEAFELE